MAQNSQSGKSKWGEDQPSKPANTTAKTEEKEKETNGPSVSKSPAGSISRSSSTAHRNDRLQERLARAMANKSSHASRNSQSSPNRSLAASPAPSNGARSSMDVEVNASSVAEGSDAADEASLPRASSDSNAPIRKSIDGSAVESSPRASGDVAERPSEFHRNSQERTDIQPPENSLTRPSVDSPRISVDFPPDSMTDEEKTVEAQRQEEIHGYIERIDALQSKLQYLAKEAAESAKSAAADAAPGSTKRQLLEKDEKIALLLEEGQKLSKSEMDHRMVIKKLRQQLAENFKIQTELKKKADKSERDAVSAEARAQRAEAAEKRAMESLSSQTKTNKDLDAVTNERNALSQTVQEMKAQLSRALARAESAEAKANSEALDQEKRKASELEEELTNLKIERDISNGKMKKEISELQEKVDQEKERARMLEIELKGEQSVLESKMESLRSRAEEASSGATGETQAKLLRQIETLQTQYSVASENWHTLEGSLLARLASVEKERDDLSKKEAELRKKIRELIEQNTKVKKLEEEVESANDAEHDLENRLQERIQDLQKLQQKLDKANDELNWKKNALNGETKSAASNQPEVYLLFNPFADRATSILCHPHCRTLGRLSRRSSAFPFASPDIGTPPRQNSYPTSLAHEALSPPPLNTTGPSMIMETPEINFEPDEFFSGTPATPSAAGPSVQLVERMSATVRRLESERAGSKDELMRVTAQRDESRQQVVDLMRELEEKRSSDARVQELENQLKDIDQRYQTTLEMLGEKSEQVEELQADIADLKKIYRELVDSTMK
ncbi:hypothetical protein N7470_008963 [Penicillium chermesinum]|nr:hypothetical protein N7470_008963 [Penicillium chermesinum]